MKDHNEPEPPKASKQRYQMKILAFQIYWVEFESFYIHFTDHVQSRYLEKSLLAQLTKKNRLNLVTVKTKPNPVNKGRLKNVFCTLWMSQTSCAHWENYFLINFFLSCTHGVTFIFPFLNLYSQCQLQAQRRTPRKNVA